MPPSGGHKAKPRSTNVVYLLFEQILGNGVSSFSLRNIDPGVDANNPRAFPIQLAFASEGASFTLSIAVPCTGVTDLNLISCFLKELFSSILP